VIAERLAKALIVAGVEKERIAALPTQQEAMFAAARLARAGDALVVFGTDVRKSVPELRSAFNALTLRDQPDFEGAAQPMPSPS
jgi:hypothetical protein